MFRRSLTTFAFVAAVISIAAPAPAATTYPTVTLTVPVTIDAMPLGTTAMVGCQAPAIGFPTSFAEKEVPVQTQNGFVVYHGAPIVVVLKNGTGGAPGSGTPTSLVSGVLIGCSITWLPVANPNDPAKSTLSTSFVKLP